MGGGVKFMSITNSTNNVLVFCIQKVVWFN